MSDVPILHYDTIIVSNGVLGGQPITYPEYAGPFAGYMPIT